MTMLVNPYRHAVVGATDPNFASVKLLLSMDGTNGSTTFTDESPAAHGSGSAITTGNSPLVTTADMVFGTGSARYDPANDGLTFPDSADWTLPGDFTAEMWVKFDDNTKLATFMAHYNSLGNQRGWDWQYRGIDATDNMALVGSTNGSSASFIMQPAWTPANNTWYFICLERSGTTFRMYAGTAGGTASMLGKVTSAFAFFDCTSVLSIGSAGSTGAPESLSGGYIDEVRLTVGVARYNNDSGFLVPTAAFPRS